jgi:signal transduction histidine kinase
MRIRTELLVIMISLVSVSIVIISYIAIDNFTKTIKSEIENEFEIVAVNLMDKLSRQMFERLADMHFLSISNILGNTNFTLPAKMNYLRDLEKTFKSYASISIYNIKGIKIGDTRSILLGANESQTPFYKHAIKGEIYYDKIPVLSDSLKQFVIHFSGPIYDGKGKISGIVVSSYPINKINDVLKQPQVQNPSGGVGSAHSSFEIDLVSNDGLVIFSNHDRKSAMQKYIANSEIYRLLNASTSSNGNNMAFSTIEHRSDGDEIMVGIKQAKGFLDYRGSGWFLILGESSQIVFGDLQTLLNQFIISAGIILGIAITLAFLFSGRVSTPIAELRKLTMEVSNGNYNTKVHTKHSNELGQLASSFESMRQNVNTVNNNLNNLVTERTRDLQRVNDELQLKEQELEKANEELKVADRGKEEFMSMVSHELKTPLTPMKLYSQMMLRSTSSIGTLNDKQKKAVTVILNGILKLEVLINDILAVYKLDMGRLTLSQSYVGVEEIISQVFTEFKPLADERKIDLVVDKRTSGTIECDLQRTIQVLSNLIKNSIDFVPKDNGRIVIRVEDEKSDSEDNRNVLFTVEDNGCGISPDKVKNLFKKFYQINTALTRKHGGTGLGLAISKGIIESHGGRIWLDESYTGGASFKFTLPRKDTTTDSNCQ